MAAWKHMAFVICCWGFSTELQCALAVWPSSCGGLGSHLRPYSLLVGTCGLISTYSEICISGKHRGSTCIPLNLWQATRTKTPRPLVQASIGKTVKASTVKPGTHWWKSWIQHGRLRWKCRNWQQIGNKVDCCRYGRLCCGYRRLCCQFWKQIGNNVNSTACSSRLCCRYGQLCCRYGRLCCQCVRGQSDTVDFVNFQQSRSCWIRLCRQWVLGLRSAWPQRSPTYSPSS